MNMYFGEEEKKPGRYIRRGLVMTGLLWCILLTGCGNAGKDKDELAQGASIVSLEAIRLDEPEENDKTEKNNQENDDKGSGTEDGDGTGGGSGPRDDSQEESRSRREMRRLGQPEALPHRNRNPPIVRSVRARPSRLPDRRNRTAAWW